MCLIYTCIMVHVPVNRNTEGKGQHWMSSSIAIALSLPYFFQTQMLRKPEVQHFGQISWSPNSKDVYFSTSNIGGSGKCYHVQLYFKWVLGIWTQFSLCLQWVILPDVMPAYWPSFDRVCTHEMHAYCETLLFPHYSYVYTKRLYVAQSRNEHVKLLSPN